MKTNSLLRLAMGLGFAVSALAAQADNYALLLGINDYPNPVDAQGNPLKDKDGKVIDPDLKGAVNDVNAMRDILTGKYEVPAANIKVYTDKAANEAGFIEGMKWILTTAKPGDQIVFHFSGHGGQVKGGDEADGLEEVIVLADDKLVVDNLFNDIARTLANKGVHATFVFDSCHSGGMSRDPVPGEIRKFADYLSKDKNATLLQAAQARDLRQVARQAVTGRGNEKGSYAFLFASKEDQTSSDVSGLTNFPSHGIFTLVMKLVLTDLPSITLAEMVDVIPPTMEKLKFKQVPNFEYSSAERARKPLIWK